MEAAAAPAVSDGPRRRNPLYLVEQAEDVGKKERSWRFVANLRARSALEAIRAAADDERGLYRAVPVAYITEATGAGERFPSLTLT